MIKDRNIADNAMIQLSKLAGGGLGPVAGDIFYVAQVDTQAYEWLVSRVPADKLFHNTPDAINACVTSRGDHILIAPFHTETVASAAAINSNKIGTTIIGLGTGASKPIYTFSATTSTWTVTAASNVIRNIIVKPSVDSVVSPIVVSAADCTIDVELQDASAAVECVNAILTTAAADRITIDLKYRGFIAGGACVNAVRLVGVDSGRVNVDFYGVASTSIVEFHTTACHDIVVSGKFYNDGTSLTQNVVDSAGSSTWSVQGWDGNSNSNFSGGDNSAIVADMEPIGSSFIVKKDLISSNIVQTTVDITGAASGALYLEEILFETDGTGLAAGTNIEVQTDNGVGLATVCSETVANLGADKTVKGSAGSVLAFAGLHLLTTKKLVMDVTVADCTGAGVLTTTLIFKRITAGATIAAA